MRKRGREGRRESGQRQQDTRRFSSKQIEVQLNCYFPSLMDKAILLETEPKKPHCSEATFKKTQLPDRSTFLMTILCAYHPYLALWILQVSSPTWIPFSLICVFLRNIYSHSFCLGNY